MAHEIETAFFTENEAWHRLGNLFPVAPKTSEEAMIGAGCGWTVEKTPIYLPGADVAIPDFQAIVRSTDRKVLGVQGADYTPLQNVEAFKFFDPFVADGSMRFDAGGSLRGGKRVWVLARLTNTSSEVVDGDSVLPYLLLYNSHDGSLAVGVQWTAIRVVCANTLAMATDHFRSGATIKLRHTTNMKRALDLVQKAVDVARTNFTVSVDLFRQMSKIPMTVSGFEQYARTVFLKEATVGEEGVEEPVFRTLSVLVDRFENGLGTEIPGVRGTLWGGYNAITEVLDHERGRSAETRVNSSFFGVGAKIRTRALEAAKELVRA